MGNNLSVEQREELVSVFQEIGNKQKESKLKAPKTSVTWEKIKEDFNKKKELLDPETTDSIIEDSVIKMNRSISNYIKRAGISPIGVDNKDPNYDIAIDTFNNLQTLQDKYIKLNSELTEQIANLISNSDLKAKLKRIAELKGSIAKLEKALENAKQDSYISQSRQDSIEHAKKDTSYYQGFSSILGFSKPLHNITIPFLIGFGLLSFFFSGLLLKEFLSTKSTTMSSQGYGGGIFSDTRFVAALGGVLFTTVLVTILAATGRLGKVI